MTTRSKQLRILTEFYRNHIFRMRPIARAIKRIYG